MSDPLANKLAREGAAAKGLIAELRGDGHDDDTLQDMVEGETSLLEAIDAAMVEADECDSIVAGCEAQIAVYRDRATKFGDRKKRIRGLIEQALVIADVWSVKRPLATITIKRVPPKPMVTDESLVPSAFFKVLPPVLDRATLNAAVRDGATIAGVQMDNGGISLQIRRA